MSTRGVSARPAPSTFHRGPVPTGTESESDTPVSYTLMSARPFPTHCEAQMLDCPYPKAPSLSIPIIPTSERVLAAPATALPDLTPIEPIPYTEHNMSRDPVIRVQQYQANIDWYQMCLRATRQDMQAVTNPQQEGVLSASSEVDALRSQVSEATSENTYLRSTLLSMQDAYQRHVDTEIENCSAHYRAQYQRHIQSLQRMLPRTPQDAHTSYTHHGASVTTKSHFSRPVSKGVHRPAASALTLPKREREIRQMH
ncbi:hypothetical protein KIPB_004907 [Kipferlia bialata]|uniref:Uncharacterized protein n=1 Tax=Kipferlia bialata TaxID=797122 RepID=A0A9K3GI44_9EUKA|nr:hypothetical protein KIPB_004907 [Kipferlia bialata]|eukprot:g4907.t1